VVQTGEKLILVVDDEPRMVRFVRMNLELEGYQVAEAGSGMEALEKVRDELPDLVVLDVMMPNLSGIEACRAIRSQAGGRLPPILMLTGRNDLQAITDAFAAGASDFAQKGMNPRLLVERVRFLLRNRAMQEEIHSSRSKLLLAQRIARVGHWELDADGNTLHVSPMLGELLGVEVSRLQRYEEFVALLDPAEQDEVRGAFVACATGNGRFGFDHRLRAADGSVVCLHQEAELVQGAAGPDDRTVIVTLQDLTRLHHAEESVRRLSYSDSATGLPNRRYLAEQVSAALDDSTGATTTAVVAFRVHGFDRLVQARGGAFAERLLAQVAAEGLKLVYSISETEIGVTGPDGA